MSSTYYVIYPSTGANPSAAQIKAGQDATGVAAIAAGNEVARDTSGVETFLTGVTGLAASTSYKIAFVWSDGVADSNVSVGAFSTAGGASYNVVLDTSTYAITSIDTAIKADRKTALSPVNYNITGLDNVFKASRGISLGTTSYSIVGFNSNYYTNRSVVLGPSIYITEGYPIVFPTYIPSYQPAHFIFSRPVAEVLTNVGVFGGVFEAQSRSTTISRPTENTQFLASSRDLIFIRN